MKWSLTKCGLAGAGFGFGAGSFGLVSVSFGGLAGGVFLSVMLHFSSSATTKSTNRQLLPCLSRARPVSDGGSAAGVARDHCRRCRSRRQLRPHRHRSRRRAGHEPRQCLWLRKRDWPGARPRAEAQECRRLGGEPCPCVQSSDRGDRLPGLAPHPAASKHRRPRPRRSRSSRSPPDKILTQRKS